MTPSARRDVGLIARDASLFAAPIGLGFVFSVVILQLVFAVVGPEIWAAVAVGQSIGTIASVVITFGWGVVGPSGVASRGVGARERYVADSVAPRLALAALLFPVAIGLSALVTPIASARLLAAESTAVACLGGLNSSWYYTGAGRPLRLLLRDTVPRYAIVVVGMIALEETRHLGWLFLSQAVAEIVVLVLVLRQLWAAGARVRASRVQIIERILEVKSGVAVSLSGILVAQLPTVIAASARSAMLPAYVLSDKLVRYGQVSLAPLVMVGQARLPASADAERLAARARRASRWAIVLGAVVTVVFIALAPVVERLLSHHTVHPSLRLIVPLGFALGAIALSDIVGSVGLVATGGMRALVRSAGSALVIGMPACVVATSLFGVAGTAVAVGGTQVVVGGWQWWALHRRIEALEAQS